MRIYSLSEVFRMKHGTVSGNIIIYVCVRCGCSVDSVDCFLFCYIWLLK